MISTELKRSGRVIVNRLRKTYPKAQTALDHHSALELLVATILSAQCTDVRVNKVTPDLFARFRQASDYATADRSELEEMIRSTGFFRNKTKSIQGACRKIVDEFRGEVPETMEELLSLPGVARKTANVILGNYFGKACGVVVDTHVFRLSHRMGFSTAKTPDQVEKDLIALFPVKDWIDLGNLLIHHGRAVCSARQPKCDDCVVESHCPKTAVERRPAKRETTGRPKRSLGDRIRSAKRKRS
jgi:endonuclease-3